MLTYETVKLNQKIKFTGVSMFWYTDMMENAKRELVKGQIYTVSNLSLASSWTGVKLKETGDLTFSLHWFELVK